MGQKFKIKEYHVYSSKINNSEPVMIFISDLHNRSFGKDNDILINAVKKYKPDAILIGGDIIVGKKGFSVEIAKRLIRRLSKIAPVYHALGNHEFRMKETREFQEYEHFLHEENVHILDNKTTCFHIHDSVFSVTGLSLPLKCYRKFKKTNLTKSSLIPFIGQVNKNSLHILLAHNPCYGKAYFEWGADLILSGHYHGGMVRLGNRGVISPQFILFPQYSYGRFDDKGKTMLVSAGMGEHTIPLRIWNPRELVVVRFHTSDEKGKE